MDASTFAAGLTVRVVPGAALTGTVATIAPDTADWQAADSCPPDAPSNAGGRAIARPAGNALESAFSASYRTEIPPPLPTPVIDPPLPIWTSASTIAVAGRCVGSGIVTVNTTAGSAETTADIAGNFSVNVNLAPNQATRGASLCGWESGPARRWKSP
jgi:hypothetical protein